MATDPQQTADARQIVGDLLEAAIRRRASDIHIEPTANDYEIRCRVDGLLETVGKFDQSTGRALVGRLMVLAQLLTYRLDARSLPQRRASFPPPCQRRCSLRQ